MNRRAAIRALASTIAAPFLNLGSFRLLAEGSDSYSTRCVDLVRSSLVIDMLSQFKLGGFADVVPDSAPPTVRWWSHPETFTSADLARYRESSINVFHIGWGTGRDDKDAYAGAINVLAAWKKFVAYHAPNFRCVESRSDLAQLKKQNQIGILLGFQDSAHFRELGDVAFFQRLGQRVSQLTYNTRNLIGAGYEAEDRGLTAFGHAIVAEMNRAGIAVDLSHCGPRTTSDSCAASARPVLFTHANCRVLCPHPRNKSDEAIRRMAATGGVMGISSVRNLVRAREPVSIQNVLDHFDYVARLVGIEHVGIGSDIDLDGYDKLPPTMRARMLTGRHPQMLRGDIDGLNHPKRMFDLTEGLIGRSYTDAHIRLILGGNFARAFGEIWS